MTNIAIFVSGNGTNCENIIRYFENSADVNIRLVLSNKADAYALVRAQKLGIKTCVVPKAEFNTPSHLMPILQRHDINFIVLAGFLLFIPDFLIKAFPHRIINLHPALLPKYGGKGMWGHHVHEAVKASGDTETGMTVHWVSPEIDGGEIIVQYKTQVSPSDTADDIAAKEHRLEMEYFPQTIEKIIKGQL